VLLLTSLPASGGMLGLWSARRFQGAVPGSDFGLGRENA
jgi:hypothetical protein